MSVEILKQKTHRFLWIDDYLWMWDIPVERAIQKKIANRVYGDVLVAGYGLGIIQSYLIQNKKVSSFTTFEINKEVIKVCLKEYGKIYGKYIIDDFYNISEKPIADCIIGDIWDDIVPESLKSYKKFKYKAEKLLKPNGKILGWGDEYFEYLIKNEKP